MNDPTGTSTRETGGRTGTALVHGPSHLRFWLMSAAVLWLDLWSKHWVFTSLGPHEERAFIPGLIVFHRSLNDGAVFGSFTGRVGVFMIASVFALGFVFYLFASSRRTARGMHVALALILAGAIGNLYDRSMVKADVVRVSRQGHLRTAMIGTLVGREDAPVIRIGEWPDGAHPRTFVRSEVRLDRQGVVRDFIKFVPRFPKEIPKLGGQDVWPWVFNVADASLVCGVTTLVLTSRMGRRRRRQP